MNNKVIFYLIIQYKVKKIKFNLIKIDIVASAEMEKHLSQWSHHKLTSQAR